MLGREGASRSSFRTIAVLTLLPVGGLLIFLVWSQLRRGAPPSPAPRVAARPVIKVAVITPPKTLVAPATGSIVIIIDDVGFEGQPLERVMSLDPDINFSILPHGSRSADFAHRLNARGFEILCHLPMEPLGSESPGPKAILTSMTGEEIVRIVRENVASVPFARGVNNHMGSRATADRRVMESVIGALPDGMYFVDSRTGGSSVAADVAREMKVRSAARHVFLDDDRSVAAIRRQVAMLAATAASRGLAIGIGHPRASTIDVLADEIPRLRDRGFRFVRASQAVN